MESNNILVPMAAACKEAGVVTDADWEKAQSQFRILGCLWVSDLSEECKAFREIMNAHSNGYEEEGYW